MKGANLKGFALGFGPVEEKLKVARPVITFIYSQVTLQREEWP